MQMQPVKCIGTIRRRSENVVFSWQRPLPLELSFVSCQFDHFDAPFRGSPRSVSLGPLSSWHVSLASQGVEATVVDTYVMVARDKGIYIYDLSIW